MPPTKNFFAGTVMIGTALSIIGVARYYFAHDNNDLYRLYR